jgi:hypothetical protein
LSFGHPLRHLDRATALVCCTPFSCDRGNLRGALIAHLRFFVVLIRATLWPRSPASSSPASQRCSPNT